MFRLVFIYTICMLLPQQKNAGIRQQLTQALNSSKLTDSLYTKLSNERNPSPVTIGYTGALEALKARYAWDPYSKLKYLSRSEKTFAKAVTAEPHNIEIRFMRFSVEHNVPGFLGYNKHLLADREEIIELIKQGHYDPNDKTFIITVIKFLLTSKRCTPAENSYLTKALTRLQ